MKPSLLAALCAAFLVSHAHNDRQINDEPVRSWSLLGRAHRALPDERFD